MWIKASGDNMLPILKKDKYILYLPRRGVGGRRYTIYYSGEITYLTRWVLEFACSLNRNDMLRLANEVIKADKLARRRMLPPTYDIFISLA